MDYRCADALKPGDTIAVVAPSAALAEDDAAVGIAFLKELGYKVKLGKSVSAHDGYLAGSDALRAADINEAFADDGVKAIMCLRGGYGATRILPLLDYELIAAHPKIFIGFSDITALHTVFLQHCHFRPIHGTMVMSLARKASDYTKEELRWGLAHPYDLRTLPSAPGHKPEAIVPGTATGPLLGGNLMLLSVTAGTPYALQSDEGILCLEEVGEDAYSLDRMLCHIEQAGLIDGVKGLAFGEFYRCNPTEGSEYEWTVEDVIRAYAKKWGKPAVMGLSFGHGADNAWLPLGQTVRLEATENRAELVFLP
ncbi:LD-carboxypeptidase [uncultured Megasphaera sp.]|uniref:S66 peptidase family protein n=1 Tax=uncultured Megasphaera sp. TaxID=165188 RepID=UPI0025F4E6D9|nr:LD-carboxypeptidase [uncultured Megasphaera sp.]